MRVCVCVCVQMLSIRATKDTFRDFYNTMNTNVTKQLLTLASALAVEPRKLVNYPVRPLSVSEHIKPLDNKTSKKNLQFAI